jgi:hypothetical protein
MSPSIEVSNDPRAPRERREVEREPISVGQLDVDQERRGLTAGGLGHRRCDAAGFADQTEATVGEQPSGQLAELRVVIDHKN